MALWAGSVINTNETAFVFNKMATKKAIPIVRNINGFLYGILGKEEVGTTPGASVGFERLKTITGKNVEVTLLGQVDTPTTVADANQTANATINYNASAWGAAEFPIAHYSWVFGLPDSELMRFQGDELKTASFLDDWFQRVMLSYEKAWGTAMSYSDITNTTNMTDVSRTVLGSWVYAIAGNNNLNAAVTAATWNNSGSGATVQYGTINRADNTNDDFRGAVFGAQGDLTLGKILLAKNRAKKKGGLVTLGVAAETLYTKIEGLVSSYTQTAYDEQWGKFQGAYTMYAGIRFVLDSYCDSTIVGLFDPTTWQFYSKMETFATSGLMRDIRTNAAHVLHTSPWAQLVCMAPARNAILGGLTS